ncbi:hypothetical protein VZT92_015292 [Zoarces viviparus]|uniref:Secreted protein n=1 Tax=Zoarces viviparus TaxID=48416 RepID=A0AAW1EW24_ZOAVI
MAALRQTLLTLPLLFDSLRVSPCPVPPPPSSALPGATPPPHVTPLPIYSSSPSLAIIQVMSAPRPVDPSTAFCPAAPAGPAPIILRIDLCSIDER